MHAAVAALREQGPSRVVIAVPTAAPETCDAFRDAVDEIVCAITPDPFYAVGLWYEDFSQTTDDAAPLPSVDIQGISRKRGTSCAPDTSWVTTMDCCHPGYLDLTNLSR